MDLETENEQPDGRNRKFRHRSSDVQSLDSWSEITHPESSHTRLSVCSFGNHEKLTDEEPKLRNELVLNPAALSVKERTDNTDEAQITRVKLKKSVNCDVSPGTRGRNVFFRIPENESRIHDNDWTSNQEETSVTSTEDKDMDYNFCTCADCTLNRGRNNRVFSQNKSSQYVNRHSPMNHKQKHFKKLGHQRLQDASTSGQDEDGGDQSDKVKNKIMSVWNNVKYGWTLKTKASFQEDSPIFLLGSCYHKRPDDDEVEPGQRVSALPSMEQFKRDFQSRLWFTYRRDFQALPKTHFTTDCGWGCMLRSSQMILAQAFVAHFLGRDWRVYDQKKEQETFYRQIISWFGDSPSDQCPFSIHRLAELGKSFGKQPGDWYGPSSVAYIIRDAVNKSAGSQTVLKDFCVYVAQDCTVYKQDIIDMCTTRPRNFTMSNSSTDSVTNQSTDKSNSDTKDGSNDIDKAWRRPVIILIPVRLGGEQFNPIYGPCIKNLLAQDSCLGLIGGKPKHSLYFTGWQGDKLIYLDPHLCQDFVDTQKRDFKIESYHCFSPRKIAITKMDPSATVGFYCRTKADFDRFVEHTEQMVTPSKGNGVYPMFVFNEGQGKDLDINGLSLSMEKSLRITHVRRGNDGKVRSYSVDSEDYVVL